MNTPDPPAPAPEQAGLRPVDPPAGAAPAAAGVGRALGSLYDEIVAEELPETFRALLDRL